MKFLVFLCCLLSTAFAIDEGLAQEMKAIFMENLNNCVTEEKAGPDDVASFKQHKIPESHQGKCVIYCMHKIYKIQNDDGQLDPEGGRKVIETLKDIDADMYEKMSTIFNKCIDGPNDADPCVTAATFAECAINESKALGFDEDLVE